LVDHIFAWQRIDFILRVGWKSFFLAICNFYHNTDKCAFCASVDASNGACGWTGEYYPFGFFIGKECLPLSDLVTYDHIHGRLHSRKIIAENCYRTNTPPLFNYLRWLT
jgi:hypothetical protein